MKEQFLEKYKMVFNEDNSVKACGRTKCIELIQCAKKLNSDLDFGSIETGIMNVDNLILLKTKLEA